MIGPDDHQGSSHRDAGAEVPQDDGAHHEPAANPTGPGSWRRDASGRWTVQGARGDPVEEPDGAEALEAELEAKTDPGLSPPPPRPAPVEMSLVASDDTGGARVLSQAHFQALSDVPAVMVWLANIDNPNTRRAYQGDLEDFLGSAGSRARISSAMSRART